MFIKNWVKKIYWTPIIQRACLTVVKPFYPPPYLDPLMELKYSIWVGISSIHCHDGRQLGENNAGPKFFREYLPTRSRESSLSNEQGKLLINVTALESVMRNWDPAVLFVRSMRKLYREKYCPNRQLLTVFDIYFFAKMCVCVPAYQARKNQPLVKDGEIDAVSATQFQLISGMFMIVREMIEQGETWLNPDLVMDAETFFDYGANHGVFDTEAGFTCAGSKRKILELMRIVIGPEQNENDSEEMEIEKRYLGDHFQDFISYFENAVKIELLVKLGRVLAAKLFYSSSQQFKDDVLSKSQHFNTLGNLCFNAPDSLLNIHTQESLLLGFSAYLSGIEAQTLQSEVYKQCSSFAIPKSESIDAARESKILSEDYISLVQICSNVLQELQNKLQFSLGKEVVAVHSPVIHKAVNTFSLKRYDNIDFLA